MLLTESIDDEDEVLSVMAEELGVFKRKQTDVSFKRTSSSPGKFVDYVGGAEFAFEILTPLEALSTVEESSVRDKVRVLLALCDKS